MDTLIVIALIYIFGSFTDFLFKEVTIQIKGWKNIPKILHHPQWWIITWIYMLYMFYIGYMMTGDYKIFLGVILFQWEDLLYYTYKFIFYNKWLPDTLNYLDPLNIFNKDYTKYNFLSTLTLFTILFVILYFIIL